jgi:hypothetical protein
LAFLYLLIRERVGRRIIVPGSLRNSGKARIAEPFLVTLLFIKRV